MGYEKNFQLILSSLKTLHSFIANISENEDVASVKVRMKAIENVQERFCVFLSKLQVEEPDFDCLQLQSQFEESYYETKAMYQHYIDTIIHTPVQVESKKCESREQKINLPSIQLQTFSGNYEDWKSFEDMFLTVIHNNTQLSAIQKFYYLKSCLKNDALSVIDSIPVTDVNYTQAWKSLCDRYENVTFIVNSHLKSIIEYPQITKNHGLRQLLSNMKQQLCSLQNLKLPINQWDVILVYIISNKLDNQTKRDWILTRTSNQLPTVNDLFQFIDQRCLALEIITNQEQFKDRGKSKVNSFKCTISKQNVKCQLCNAEHKIYSCDKFLELNTNKRIQTVKQLRLCFNCLHPNCSSNSCQRGACKICHKKHNSLLHYNKETHSDDKFACSSTDNIVKENSVTLLNSNQPSEVLLSTCVVYVTDVNNRKQKARALLDSASQSSFVTYSFMKRLGIKQNSKTINVSGISSISTNINSSVNIEVSSCNSSFKRNIEFLILEKITNNLPSTHINSNNWKIPVYIELADPGFNCPSEIDLLLGAEIFFDALLGEKILLNPELPTLCNSVFGWIIAGKISSKRGKNMGCAAESYSVQSFVATQNCCDKMHEQLSKFWTLEEVIKPSLLTKEESLCEEIFHSTVSRNEHGRYIVNLPLKDHPSILGNSINSASRRFTYLENKLNSRPELRQQYCNFIKEYIDLGHMQLVTETNNNTCFYLPHHAVLKESSSSTKLRVVFDGSASTSSNKSLNDILMVGPVVQQDLQFIVLRFRTHKFVFTADIVKMYRQIQVIDKHCDLQRILWRDNPDSKIQIYRLKTVTYGTASAPYLATKCLQQLSKDEGHNFPAAAERSIKDFYVDDLLTGCNTVQEAIELKRQFINLLLCGGFELRKWSANNDEILTDIPEIHREVSNQLSFSAKDSTVKTLGILWQPNTDCFKFHVKLHKTTKLSKRVVLSEVAQIFDPLGLIGPVVIRAKMYIQELWKLKSTWDCELPIELTNIWINFRNNLALINNITIPRWIGTINSKSKIQIHGFADASEQAYGAVIYARSQDDDGNISVNMLCSKSRVAPLKQITLARLELCGAILLARLLKTVIIAVELQIDSVYCWSDSEIVLAWIRAPPTKWKTFVANRVSEIQDLTNTFNWNHVMSNNNPADLITRGLDASELKNSTLWWHGPSWLYNDNLMNLKSKDLNINEVPEQKTPKIITVLSVNGVDILNICSTWIKLTRITAYIFRFYRNISIDKQNKQLGFLTTKELENAKIFWCKVVQYDFSEDLHFLHNGRSCNKSKLNSLHPFLDEHGLIRVGGRLHNANMNFDRKHPIILSSTHIITKMIATHLHIVNLHCGPQALLSLMRLTYWPINGKNMVKRIVHNCVKCFRVRPRITTPLMGQLPTSRVTPSRPFMNTCVDFCGPFMLRQSLNRNAAIVKAYVAVFVCMAVKAIHIELVSDLTSDSFIASLRRFVARRGLCLNIYCDNATNFVGAQRKLKEFHIMLMKKANEENISRELTAKGITWHFLPPNSPHFGGLHEAAVKSVKHHLRRIVGDKRLVFEELYTFLTQIEACLNSRPIVALSNDPNDLTALTPSHFLIGDVLLLPPEPELKPVNNLKRWSLVQCMFKHFWNRWHCEYLTQLQSRTKWRQKTENLGINDLVLIKEDHIQPMNWCMGRVIQLHPGKDDVVRVATVKTPSGELKRSVVKLCKLPV